MRYYCTTCGPPAPRVCDTRLSWCGNCLQRTWHVTALEVCRSHEHLIHDAHERARSCKYDGDLIVDGQIYGHQYTHCCLGSFTVPVVSEAEAQP